MHAVSKQRGVVAVVTLILLPSDDETYEEERPHTNRLAENDDDAVSAVVTQVVSSSRNSDGSQTRKETALRTRPCFERTQLGRLAKAQTPAATSPIIRRIRVLSHVKDNK